MKNFKPLEILIVDDSAENRAFLNLLFRRNKLYKVLGCTASTIEAARLIIERRHAPDIVLLDLFMPLKNGSKLLYQLEKFRLVPKKSTIILSAIIRQNQQLQIVGQHAVRFLLKPMSVREFRMLPDAILQIIN